MKYNLEIPKCLTIKTPLKVKHNHFYLLTIEDTFSSSIDGLGTWKKTYLIFCTQGNQEWFLINQFKLSSIRWNNDTTIYSNQLAFNLN